MALKSHYWKYLVEIAKAGGLVGNVPLTTTKVGELVGTSQQTASRKLVELENQGYIHRTDIDGDRGQKIALTEKGIIELRRLYGELTAIFAVPGEIVMRGKIISGLGEGKYYVGKYLNFFKKNLSIVPFKGTLNVKLLDEHDVFLRSQIEVQGGILMRGFTEQERSFGDVFAYRVNVARDDGTEKMVPAYFLKIERTHYDKSVIELISNLQLRNELQLDDGDTARIIYKATDQK
ncbi:MAG TPA: DUF120 domain-containing protein [Candidatus Lokiarchaeia archaeon]|nr:DUF120 domain-containing protein [Candidatus Lokiarchaeia archaeon]